MAIHQDVFFCRVAWMVFYNGDPDRDPPVGGGAQAQKAEILNFQRVSGRFYGWAQPAAPAGTLNLLRINPNAPNPDILRGVLVVFVATHPPHGQVIVGWYRNADVYGIRQQHPGRDQPHVFSTDAADAVLLPTRRRTHSVRGGKGGFGQANIRYRFSPKGESPALADAWMAQAIDFIESYTLENLVTDPAAEFALEAAVDADDALERAAGFQINHELRKEIEDRAMEMATKYFEGEEFTVKDTHIGNPYDLLCTKPGRRPVYVEVKGTMTRGMRVILTTNEVHLALPQGERCLFVVHSIKANAGHIDQGSGQVRRPIFGWSPAESALRPLSYMYELPEDRDAAAPLHAAATLP